MSENGLPKNPSYRLHKPSGQAVVTVNGRDHYLGRHNSAASRQAYDRLIGEWLANGRQLLNQNDNQLTVTEVIAAYWRHAKEFYQKDGWPTGELGKVRFAKRALRRLYGRTRAAEFGPLALKTVRQVFVDAGNSRRTVNDQVSRIKRLFRWATENELVPPSVFHGLHAVSGLRRGRSVAREPIPVRPVPDDHIAAVQIHVSKQVWAMIQLQQLTGMRPGEVAMMRRCDFDISGEVWLYRPASHKTEHFGCDRVVDIGPRAQAVLRPFLKADLSAFLFSPAEVIADRNAERRRNRRTKLTPSQRARRPKLHPKRRPRNHYDRDSYRRAISRACALAKVPHWHPHQLRHNYATQIRKEFGVEAARILLGHRSTAVTEFYAEVDRGRVRDIVARVG